MEAALEKPQIPEAGGNTLQLEVLEEPLTASHSVFNITFIYLLCADHFEKALRKPAASFEGNE